MSELLGHMEYISKLYTLGGIQQACSLFMAFHMQAFACARPETGFGEMDTHDLVTEYLRLESYVIKDFQVLSRMLNEEVTASVWNTYEKVCNVLRYSVPTYGRMLLPGTNVKNLVAMKNIILNARKLHGDVVNNQYAGISLWRVVRPGGIGGWFEPVKFPTRECLRQKTSLFLWAFSVKQEVSIESICLFLNRFK